MTAVDAAVGAVLDAHCAAFGSKVQVPGCLGARYFGVERAPLGGGLASLDAEPLLDAHPAIVGGRELIAM